MEMEIWCVDRWYGNGDGNEGLRKGKERGDAMIYWIDIGVSWEQILRVAGRLLGRGRTRRCR